MARKKPVREQPRHVQTIQMGLGEAVKRLITVEFQFRMGTNDQKLLDERAMLLEAMDHIPIEIGFDCNSDGVPDTVAIFQQAAVTSCCRLLPYESSRKSPASETPDPAEVPVDVPDTAASEPVPVIVSGMETITVPVEVPVRRNTSRRVAKPLEKTPEEMAVPVDGETAAKPVQGKKKGFLGLFGKDK